jgi:hypothetical protein
MPKPPETTVVVPLTAARREVWRYTTRKPPIDWNQPTFDDKSWSEGKAGFGTPDTPGADVGTEWKTPDIWLRRTFTLPKDAQGPLVPYVIYDEDPELWIDGFPAGRLKGYVTEPTAMLRVTPAAQARLKPGATIVVAVHVRNAQGGQYIDVGFASLGWKKK